MKRGALVGGVLLSLGGWTCGLSAQEGWRSAGPGPVPVTLGAGELRPVPLGSPAVVARPAPVAELGRPMAVPEPDAPRRFLDGPAQSGVLAASYVPAAEPAALPPAVATEPDLGLADAEPSLFAADRSAPPAPRRPADERAVQPTAARAEPPPPAPPPAPVLPVVPQLPAAPLLPPDDVPHADPLHKNFYFTAEYLLWTTTNDRIPALVTTSAPGDDGILGRPTTQVLLGGALDRDPRSGARFTGGYWLDMWCTEAVELSGFFLAEKSDRFRASSAQFPVLARPFFSLNQQAEVSELIASPGVAIGNVVVRAPGQLWGVELNMRCKACGDCDWRVDWFAGPRYLNLEESLLIIENVVGLAGAPAPLTNSTVTVSDFFAGRNSFIGAQVGAAAAWRRGRWVLDARGKLALGGTYHEIAIDGSQVLVPPGGPSQRFTGGLLALPSNIGTHQQGSFTFVPELTLSAGYQVSDHVKLTVGYNLLYWSSVVRPGRAIDRVIDETLIPNFPTGVAPATHDRPAVIFDRTGFWAQGLNLGVEFRY